MCACVCVTWSRERESDSMLAQGQRLQEEQDYVQAYENVREKYKGKEAILHLVDILEQVNSEW